MRLDKLLAALSASLFFSALPLWFLSHLEGPTQFACGGVPWRCTVSRWVFFETTTSSYQIEHLGTQTRARHGKRADYAESRITVTNAAGSVIAVTEWGDEDNASVVHKLEAARKQRMSVLVNRPPSFLFWLAVALVAVFAAAGLFLVLAGDNSRSMNRHRQG